MIEFTDAINFDSSIPYYTQLKTILEEQIRQNIFRAGDHLPSHSELCDQYGVSKAVVRQALKQLEIEGLIVQRRGKLTMIAEKKIPGDLLQQLSGTYHNMTRLGYYPTTRVILNHVILATESIAKKLEIKPMDQVIELERLRFIEDEPFVFMRSYVPYDLCPKIAEIDLTGKSLLDEIKREYGFVISSSKRTIEAVSARETEANLLKISRGAPLLLFNSVSFIDTGRVIGSTRALFRGDRARFDVEIGDINERV
ncbi:transcriptional regulator [Longilinea arvoryzae]|uniref:Transcriptional regulator n=2 Tax=Longilinea arvoryzae TaxID=360412 RepID=A0A0S7BEK5_9CHLR|nr:transcriptional regulator [Longilinea arvoryzae]